MCKPIQCRLHLARHDAAPLVTVCATFNHQVKQLTESKELQHDKFAELLVLRPMQTPMGDIRSSWGGSLPGLSRTHPGTKDFTNTIMSYRLLLFVFFCSYGPVLLSALFQEIEIGMYLYKGRKTACHAIHC